jgi:hypothetical protein
MSTVFRCNLDEAVSAFDDAGHMEGFEDFDSCG